MLIFQVILFCYVCVFHLVSFVRMGKIVLTRNFRQQKSGSFGRSIQVAFVHKKKKNIQLFIEGENTLSSTQFQKMVPSSTFNFEILRVFTLWSRDSHFSLKRKKSQNHYFLWLGNWNNHGFLYLFYFYTLRAILYSYEVFWLEGKSN